MKKITVLLIAFSMLLSSCQTSKEELKKQIDEQVNQQIDLIVAQTQTANPTTTLTPLPAATETPHMPVHEEPAISETPNYILEFGYCPNNINNLAGNPKNISNCIIVESYKIQYKKNYGYKLNTAVSDSPSQQEFCSIYQLDGTFLFADFDASDSVLDCTPHSDTP